MLDDEKKHLIELYFDSQLDESRVAEAMQLLEQSDEARQYYAELKAMAEQAEGLMLEGGDDFWRAQKDSILDKIAETEDKKIIPVKAANKFMRLRTLAVAASLILVGVITVYEVRQMPEFNRPKEDAMPRMAPAVVDTTITKVQDKDAVNEVALTPEVESRVGKDEKVLPPPEPSPATEQVMMAETPAITHEKSAEWQTPVIEPQTERKLDASRSYLIQPATRHEEITVEQGMEALDRGRTEEPTDEAATSGPESRKGVGIKQKELAKPQTIKGKISDMPVVSVDSLLKLNSSDYVYGQDGKIVVRSGRAGEVAYTGAEKESQEFVGPRAMAVDIGKSIIVNNSDEVDSLTYWSRRLDSLAYAVDHAASPHNRMEIGKVTRQTGANDTLSSDSLRWHFAEAIYKTAIFSPDSVDIRQYIYKLSRVKSGSDKALAQTIARYISELESRKK